LKSGGYTALTWNGASSLRHEPCNSNFVVGLPSSAVGGIFFTNDEFETSEPLTVTLGTLVSATLTEVQVTKSYVYFLVNDGSLFALDRASKNGVAKLITPKLQGQLKGLKVPEWCTNPSSTSARDVFVAWSDTEFAMGTSTSSPSEYFTVAPESSVLPSGTNIIGNSESVARN
jgi:hypothetical protein